MASIIPLTNAPNQAFLVSLTVDGKLLALQIGIRYNEIASYWVLTISDAAGNLLLDSIPMLTGAYPAANILGQYAYLKIGSAFLVNASGIAKDNPDATNLGSDFQLIWDDTPLV